MVPNNVSETYLNTKIMTATPEELTLMLYDGALKFCNQAIMAIENKNIQDAHNFIIKAENIITEFRSTLDDSYEVSKNFDIMYEYINRRLSEANLKKDSKIVEEAQGFIREMRDTWKEAMTLAKVKKVSNE